MVGQIPFRPYTDCPWQWDLIVNGISSGVGTISTGTCLQINSIRFDSTHLRYKPCTSEKGTLTWTSPTLGCALDVKPPCGFGDCNLTDFITTSPITMPSGGQLSGLFTTPLNTAKPSINSDDFDARSCVWMSEGLVEDVTVEPVESGSFLVHKAGLLSGPITTAYQALITTTASTGIIELQVNEDGAIDSQNLRNRRVALYRGGYNDSCTKIILEHVRTARNQVVEVHPTTDSAETLFTATGNTDYTVSPVFSLFLSLEIRTGDETQDQDNHIFHRRKTIGFNWSSLPNPQNKTIEQAFRQWVEIFNTEEPIVCEDDRLRGHVIISSIGPMSGIEDTKYKYNSPCTSTAPSSNCFFNRGDGMYAVASTWSWKDKVTAVADGDTIRFTTTDTNFRFKVTRAQANRGASYVLMDPDGIIIRNIGSYGGSKFYDYQFINANSQDPQANTRVNGFESSFLQVRKELGNPAQDYSEFPDTIELNIDGTRTLSCIQPGDKTRSQWVLEYDISAMMWTLHSCDSMDFPIYTLADNSPCVGNTKTLTLQPRISTDVNGCEVAPGTVTITRDCPANLSPQPRDITLQGHCRRTRASHRCDCQNRPHDLRWSTISKCAGITTPGCEEYGSDVACRYPLNQITCDVCTEQDPPCTYEALFANGRTFANGLCDIIYNETDIAASIVTLRQKCRFEGPCNWVAVGPTGDKRDGVVGHEPYCMLCAEFSVGTCASNCTWEAVQAGLCPTGDKPGLLNPPINILAKWGISWSLNVAEPATLTYDHPSFGVLIYTTSEEEPWLCDNVNTMYLTAQGTLPDGVMPESICVRPRYSGCGGAMDYDVKSIDYAEVEDQVACCDPACGSIGPFPIRIQCCTNFEECSTSYTAQTLLLGRDSPAGPSYLGSCTLHGVLWTAVIYCDGVRWKTDWYCKSPREFITTTTHTHTCCPLFLSFEWFGDVDVNCCPVQECQCCDTSGTNYETLDMSITFPAGCAQDRLPAACTFSRPVTMTLSMVRSGTYPNHVWTVDPVLCDPDYGFDMSLTCGTVNPGQWDFYYNFGGGIPAAVCNPNSGTLTATNQALCPAILLEWTNPIVCDDPCVLVSNITITS